MRRGRRQALGLAALVVGLLAGCADRMPATPTPSGGSPSPSLSPTASPTPSPTPSPEPVPSASRSTLSLELQRLGSFASPVWVGSAPRDAMHLYLAQRSGAVLQLDAHGVRQGVVLDLHGQVSTGSEQGLLSIAFDPAYPRVPRLYVDYTDLDGSTRVVAYTLEEERAVRPQLLLTVPQPYPNHNGGLILFDRTGMLLVGTGDGGNAGDPENRAQDLQSLLGKILRIDPRTGGPAAGNPYPENRYVWALGLRNPWRFTFDRRGDLYLGDVGQTRVEELDVVPPALQRGANYGWSVYEGDELFKDDEALTPGGALITPALTYPHAQGSCSITVGPVYEGRLAPPLRGSLLYGDYCAGRLLAVTRTAQGVGVPQDLGLRAKGLQGFGVDGGGEVLVLTVDALSRLVPSAP